jgi:hypothetical protein
MTTLSDAQLGVTLNASAWLTNYGPFAWGPNIIVWHSLECDAIARIAEQLSARGGYLDNEGLAPQRMTDPAAIVRTMADGLQGGHIGGPGNSHCGGAEVSGRAAWTPAQWALPNARAAVDHQARAVAGLAVNYGWAYTDLRWLAIAQIRAGSPRGMCSHNDISVSGISGTNHWDPGLGFPFAWALERTQYWYRAMTGTATPSPVAVRTWLQTLLGWAA